MQKSDLPIPLQTLLDISKVNMVKMDLSKKDNHFIATSNSKIGGIGYLPFGESYPSKADGTPLILLIQINFGQLADTVDMSKLPYQLPKQGILQIYIDGKDEDYLYGCDLDNFLPHDQYQVRFWSDVNAAINNDELDRVSAIFKSLAFDDLTLPFDFKYEFAISFVLGQQSCDTTCYEYHQISQKIPELDGIDIWDYFENLNIDDSDEYLETYNELSNTDFGQHHLLGYPNFTQTDPRTYYEDLQGHILLLQLETDDDNDIMWGDCGVANFFIRPDDLNNQDFSKLLYNWDCC